MYRPIFAKTVVYMLQATEYSVDSYLKWLWRATDFGRIMYRKTLIMTRPAKLLFLAMAGGMLAQIIAAVTFTWWDINTHHYAYLPAALTLLLATPLVWAHLIVLPLLFGRWMITKPVSKVKINRSGQIFTTHPAIKIAVAGSYGKTTMKEILLSVLSEGKNVAATPANKNVAISHAQYAARLKGDEDILIIEYGEGAPGDVAHFTRITKPNIAIITGLAPAHLDKYKTLQAAGRDVFSLAGALPPSEVYVNGESEAARAFIKKGFNVYDSRQVLGWRISNVKVSVEGLSFTMNKASKTLKLKNQLLGRHQIGNLALAAALADKFGLSEAQIVAGVAKIKPFEHRMQPYQLGGAWVIDDTYNGNIEGMLAGLKLLKELQAKRKVYITPGLVDQGADSRAIHEKLGRAIAAAEPDEVVLIKHSVTEDILRGMEKQKHKIKLRIEEDPLDFYTHLDQFVAAGDLVLMQNDWPDNYN